MARERAERDSRGRGRRECKHGAGSGNAGTELRAKECRLALEAEEPSRERGPPSWNRRELNSANDLVKQENRLSPAVSQDDHGQHCGSLDFSVVTL